MWQPLTTPKAEQVARLPSGLAHIRRCSHALSWLSAFFAGRASGVTCKCWPHLPPSGGSGRITVGHRQGPCRQGTPSKWFSDRITEEDLELSGQTWGTLPLTAVPCQTCPAVEHLPALQTSAVGGSIPWGIQHPSGASQRFQGLTVPPCPRPPAGGIPFGSLPKVWVGGAGHSTRDASFCDWGLRLRGQWPSASADLLYSSPATCTSLGSHGFTLPPRQSGIAGSRPAGATDHPSSPRLTLPPPFAARTPPRRSFAAHSTFHASSVLSRPPAAHLMGPRPGVGFRPPPFPALRSRPPAGGTPFGSLPKVWVGGVASAFHPVCQTSSRTKSYIVLLLCFKMFDDIPPRRKLLRHPLRRFIRRSLRATCPFPTVQITPCPSGHLHDRTLPQQPATPRKPNLRPTLSPLARAAPNSHPAARLTAPVSAAPPRRANHHTAPRVQVPLSMAPKTRTTCAPSYAPFGRLARRTLRAHLKHVGILVRTLRGTRIVRTLRGHLKHVGILVRTLRGTRRNALRGTRTLRGLVSSRASPPQWPFLPSGVFGPPPRPPSHRIANHPAAVLFSL